MINRALLKVLALFPMLLLLSAGSCNRTDIRNAGTIESGSNVFKTGGKYVFTLRVPDELEGKVYRAMWYVVPESAGSLEYVENSILGKDACLFKNDREAVFLPVKKGAVTIEVSMIYYRQTSPQLFAKKEIIVEE